MINHSTLVLKSLSHYAIFTAFYRLNPAICGLTQNVYILITFRIIQGIGACSGPLMARAIINDIYSTKESAKLLGVIASIMGIVPAASPVIGSYMTYFFGWRSNFLLMFIFCLFALLLLQFTLNETHLPSSADRINTKELLSKYLAVITDRCFIVYCTSMCLFYSGFFTYISQAPLLFKDLYNIDSRNFSHYFAIIILAYALGSFLASRAHKYLNIHFVALLASSTGLIGTILLFAVKSFHHYLLLSFLPICIYALATGLILSTGMAGSMKTMQKHLSGAASGMLGFLQMLFSACISSFASFLYDKTLYPLSLLLFITAILAFSLLVKLGKRGE